jgi:hypothetical protein
MFQGMLDWAYNQIANRGYGESALTDYARAKLKKQNAEREYRGRIARPQTPIESFGHKTEHEMASDPEFL